MPPIVALATDRLTVRFGGVTAIDGVSMAFRAAELTGIIGPNGAGKTTFIDAVSGLVHSTGEITIGDQRISGWSPHRRAQAGLGRTFQGLELFDEFTVEQNLLVPAEAGRRWSFIRDLVDPRPSAAAVRAVADALERVGQSHLAEAYPPTLSLGERKLVSIARALAGGADVLLLDEPAAGLNADASLELGASLRDLVATGVTVALIDHDMGLVLGVCDQIHVLEYGKLIASGTPSEIRADPAVIEAYLGDGDAAAAATEEVRHG